MNSLSCAARWFLVAGLLSLGVPHLWAQNSPSIQSTATPGAATPHPVNAARLKFLTEKLGLDGAQQGKIRDILEEDTRKMSELTSPAQRTGESVRELNRARDAAIEAVLTPQQREKYKALVNSSPVNRLQIVGSRPTSAPHSAQGMANRAAAVDGLQVELGPVHVSSKSENDQSSLGIVLELKGPLLQTGKAHRVVVTEAKDDSGKSLRRDQASGQEFGSLNNLIGDRPQTAQLTEVIGMLADGEPEVLSSLTGIIEVVLPERDPSSVVTVDFGKHIGVPLKNPALLAAGVEILFEPLRGGPSAEKPNEQWYLVYKVKDPHGKLAGEAEFYTAAGQQISLSGANGAGRASIGASKAARFKTKPPEDVVVKFHLATAASVVRVPFAFENVPVQPKK